jgi:hypothetical protein
MIQIWGVPVLYLSSEENVAIRVEQRAREPLQVLIPIAILVVESVASTHFPFEIEASP